MKRTYRINEWFYSLQGEGVRAGSANLFLRFSGCNEQCAVETHGFDCDTEFVSGRALTADDILHELHACAPHCRSLILTGGEPALQLDDALVHALKAADYYLAIETNGSIELPEGLDWVTVSPKVAEHAIRQRRANEVKYVRGYGQAIPRTVVEADYKLLSPAAIGDTIDRRALDWCISLVQENPDWRLSCQQHKFWSVR